MRRVEGLVLRFWLLEFRVSPWHASSPRGSGRAVQGWMLRSGILGFGVQGLGLNVES